MKVYYNEIDDSCCDWMSNLMDAGAITPGVIDNRSIEDIRPSDLVGFDRVHFFAGIGVWEYAFLMSGLAAYANIWTGSCPCQPFSAAGKGEGFADERHLWPAFYHLIKERRPSAVLGEQVASKDGLAWLDIVQSDLEAEDYACGAGDLCAAGFGAPHIRQRDYWAAFGLEHASDDGLEGRLSWRANPQWAAFDGQVGRDRATSLMADAYLSVSQQSARYGARPGEAEGAGSHDQSDGRRTVHLLGPVSDAVDRAQQREIERAAKWFLPQGDGTVPAIVAGRGPTNGFWRIADWLSCRDGKWRAVESGTFPLAHGASSRVVRLRAYGNAIVAPQAIEFCGAVREFIETINSTI